MNIREAEVDCKNDEFIMKPKVDFCFKELMEDEEIRIGFLSAVLGISKESISKTMLLPTHLRKQYEDDKLGILDVKVLLADGTKIDIEIQVKYFEFWEERSLLYLCKMFEDQMHKGDGYDVLGKCIHISILDFVMFGKSEEFASSFHLWEDKRREKYSDKLGIYVLELPKLSQYEYPETELLNWARFINAEKKEEMAKMAQTDDSLKKAYERVLEMSADEKKRLEYEEREKAIRDYNSQMKSNWKSGHKAGVIEGRVEATVKIYQQLGKTKLEVEKLLMEEFEIEEEEAKRKASEYWK